MKSLKTLLLFNIILIISMVSCTSDETMINDITEDVKSFKETLENNTNDSSTLTDEEISLLLDKDETVISDEILIHINNYRNSIGLKSLLPNNTCKEQALSHSDYQAIQNKISHNDSSVRATVIFKTENASYYGENVAFGYSSVEKLVQAWINSEPHRLNIEGDFTYSGIGTIVSDKGVLYFTQIFFK